MKVPQLLGKSSLLALAFGAEAAAAASPAPAAEAPKDPAAAAAAAAAAAEEGGDPPEVVAEQPAAPAAAVINPAAAATGDTVLASVALESMADARRVGYGEGMAASNERMRLVFESAEGQANPSMAVFLLTNSDAKAGDVIAKLKAAPAAAAPAPGRAAVQPRINLTGGNGAAAAAGEGEHDTGKDADFDPWSKVAALNPAGSALAQPALVIGGQTFNLTPQAQ